ncbi:probable LRR receptor-like serine/threonine-protein kinase At1g56130 [Humulus lupulus]|uniref:probable LRR receptor-like serine/threonine-protein kinase At1g56130 n=1 Tax=Humulus lupulus TaxID=3486 RepID=UPI002B417FA0|nr:probable LRR receptor-like serine/threonine-protein kinase At1g56130 [Humulus lupulus]
MVGIVELTLNRLERRNAIGRDFLRGFIESLEAVSKDSSANVVLIHSLVLKVFCAGNDLKSYTSRVCWCCPWSIVCTAIWEEKTCLEKDPKKQEKGYLEPWLAYCLSGLLGLNIQRCNCGILSGLKCLQRNFDIRKEAGHVSFRVVEKVFTTQVSENYLEVHLFWAGKGTCCIPKQGTYGPSISAISATAEFLGMDVRPFTFSYAELKTATNNFDYANKLGEGGFGLIYKGSLDDGRVIAVKQLSMTSHQGKSQFVAEIATISSVQHRNLIKLHGCCIEGGKQLLVYEYLESKSLDQALFRNNSLKLDWSTHFDICLGIAKGLAYLHEELRLRIIHGDVMTIRLTLVLMLLEQLAILHQNMPCADIL